MFLDSKTMHLIVIGILSTLLAAFICLLIYACLLVKKLQANKGQKVEQCQTNENPAKENPYDEYKVYDTIKIYHI